MTTYKKMNLEIKNRYPQFKSKYASYMSIETPEKNNIIQSIDKENKPIKIRKIISTLAMVLLVIAIISGYIATIVVTRNKILCCSLFLPFMFSFMFSLIGCYGCWDHFYFKEIQRINIALEKKGYPLIDFPEDDI